MTPLALALLVAAAPVPKTDPERERIGRLFGTPVDPLGDCRFRLGPDGLTIRVGEPARDLGGHIRLRRDAPRTARTVRGEFTMQVRVTADIPDDQNLIAAGSWSHTAGLAVWDGDQRGAALEVGRCGRVRPPGGWFWGFRGATWQVDNAARVFGFQQHTGSDTAGGPCWLRLTRAGDRIRFQFSPDGREWTSCGDQELQLPDGVQAGVTAGHRTAAGFTARFDEFRIDPIPAGGDR